MKTPTQNRTLAQKVDEFLKPETFKIPSDVLISVVEALDEKEVEVNAMLNDFFRTDSFGKYGKRPQNTKQVNRRTFGGRQP